jgi:hypothetical protein
MIYTLLGGIDMNNYTFKRLAYTLANLAKNALRQSVRRHNIVFTAGAIAVTALSLPLLYQMAIERQGDAPQPSQLLTAYHNNGSIALACFAAVAAGYCYWMLQLLGGNANQAVRNRMARWSDAAFILVVGSAVAALALWNISVFTG